MERQLLFTEGRIQKISQVRSTAKSLGFRLPMPAECSTGALDPALKKNFCYSVSADYFNRATT
jgi:hypothetical protein